MGTSKPPIKDKSNYIVIWIDQNNDKEENQGYLNKFSDELKNFSFLLVNSIDEGYDKLANFGFQLIYIILSGRLAEKFLDLYEENLQKLNFISLNIIFCSYYNLHISKKYANDPFYNPGGVVTNFKAVIEFLKKDRKYKIIKKNFSIENKIKRGNPFLFLQNKIENISLPTILTKFSSKFISEEDLEKCNQFLLNNYSDELKEYRCYSILSTKIKIPFYLYSKIFIRLYLAQSRFYKDLNISLEQEKFSDFKQIIFVLYYALNMKILESIYDKYLYGGASIDMQTYEEIINCLKVPKK